MLGVDPLQLPQERFPCTELKNSTLALFFDKLQFGCLGVDSLVLQATVTRSYQISTVHLRLSSAKSYYITLWPFGAKARGRGNSCTSASE
jgi:hypothetical protein